MYQVRIRVVKLSNVSIVSSGISSSPVSDIPIVGPVKDDIWSRPRYLFACTNMEIVFFIGQDFLTIGWKTGTCKSTIFGNHQEANKYLPQSVVSEN